MIPHDCCFQVVRGWASRTPASTSRLGHGGAGASRFDETRPRRTNRDCRTALVRLGYTLSRVARATPGRQSISPAKKLDLQKALPISATTKNAAFDDPHHPTCRVPPCHDGVSLPRAAEPASLWFAALPTTAAGANSGRYDYRHAAATSFERRTRCRPIIAPPERSDAADAALDPAAPHGAR